MTGPERWELRTSLASIRSRCALANCGRAVKLEPGDRGVTVNWGDGTGDPVCDDCARAHDPGLFALLVCERIAEATELGERSVPAEHGTGRSAAGGDRRG